STALCTSTLTVQVATGSAALAKLMLLAPATAVTEPPQLLTTLGVVATTRLPGLGPPTVGRLSVKLESIGTTFPLVRLKVIVLTLGPGPVPPVVWIVFGPKLFAIEGGFKMMMPAFAVPPPQVERPPGAV